MSTHSTTTFATHSPQSEVEGRLDGPCGPASVEPVELESSPAPDPLPIAIDFAKLKITCHSMETRSNGTRLPSTVSDIGMNTVNESPATLESMDIDGERFSLYVDQ